MADYRGIKGFNIQSLASDPSANTNTEGQVWYNTGSKTLKGIVGAQTAAWSSGGNMNQARAYMQGFGILTAAVIAGGRGPPSNTQYDLTETYDGTSWTTSPATLNSGRIENSCCGTSTAGLLFGGLPPAGGNLTESFNGTAWTEVNDMTEQHTEGFGGFGTQTAAVGACGNNPPTTDAEEWDGTSWAETGATSTARRDLCGAGIQTSGIIFGGNVPPSTANVETYNGSTWTETANMNTALRGRGRAGATDSAALAIGGLPSALTEIFNGTSWTEVADLATARSHAGNDGTTTAAFCAGGGADPPQINSTEEWHDPSQAVKTFTAS